MATCEYAEKCPVFNHLRLEALRDLYRRKYCEAAFAECERFRARRATGKPAPMELLPDGRKLTPHHFACAR